MGEEIELAISRIRGRHSTTQEAIDYLKPYFQAFRQRYPGSTRIFWLTEWATQGIIPAERKAAAVTQAGRAAPARNGRLEEPENKYLKSLARFGVPMETEE
jgi:hypothetical protein